MKQTASFREYDTPFQHGDTDSLPDVFPTIKAVDITGFVTRIGNFTPVRDDDPTNRPFWNEGNFNSDDNIDITDYNLVATNFAPVGYASPSLVPEPRSILLFVAAIITGPLYGRPARIIRDRPGTG